jgi:hypothetical protein
MSMILICLLLASLLFGGHAIADYGLQSAYVAEFKVRGPKNPDWFVTLFAHCLIHGICVLMAVTAVAWLALAAGGVPPIKALTSAAALGVALGWTETAIHFAIDDAKGQKRFDYRTDQLLHYGCKLLWTAIVLNFVA